jgi:integration host factor subunit beta
MNVQHLPIAETAMPEPKNQRSITKSELIEALASRQTHLAFADVELAVRNVIEQMSSALAGGDRIEIRGFGSFSLHYRPPRTGRNPKTGTAVALPGKYVPHFKPGKELRERVNGDAPSDESSSG